MYHCIVNPTAGRGKAYKLISIIETFMQAHGKQLKFLENSEQVIKNDATMDKMFNVEANFDFMVALKIAMKSLSSPTRTSVSAASGASCCLAKSYCFFIYGL